MDIQLAQIIFQIINFGLVLFILNRFIYKPILKLLNDRKTKLINAAETSRTVLQEKERLEKTKAEILSKAQQKAKKIEDEIRTTAKQEAKTLLIASKEEIKLKEAKFTKELIELKREKMKSMEKELRQAAVLMAEKVLRESIDAKKHQKLIDQQIDEIIESL